MQVVYELFLRFIVSSEVSGKVTKKFVDQSFLRQWIELFDAGMYNVYLKCLIKRSVFFSVLV
jgi:serine/threonine-protein phosphatase 2A regulatory subunit B'